MSDLTDTGDQIYDLQNEIERLQARVEALEAAIEGALANISPWTVNCDYRAEPDLRHAVTFLLAATEQDESLSDKLKRLGYKEIRDAKCVMCKKPINSQVDGLFCSVACQIAAQEGEGDE